MKFARNVYILAGLWGFIVLIPIFWLVDISGHHYVPPPAYPQFFYGFLMVAMAWQLAFLIIGSNPARFRPVMIATIIEKFGFVAVVAVLFARARIPAIEAQAAIPDFLLGILFVVAFMKTRIAGKRVA